MTTATLTRPAVRSSLSSIATPFRPAVPASPAALPSIPPVAMPAGLEQWRTDLAQESAAPKPTRGQVARVLDGIRHGMTLAQTARIAKMSQARVLDAVVGVGSRMSQANKSGTKVGACLSPRRAARSGMHLPGAVQHDGQMVVVMAEGWHKSEQHGRDVARCYAAVVVSDPWDDARAIARWLDTQSVTQPVTYAHFSHLRSVANGTLSSFEGLTEDRDVKQAYITAFEDIAAAIGAASSAVLELCQPSVSPGQVVPLLRRCYWMVPSARVLAMTARAAAAGDSRALAQLQTLLSNLRTAIARQPASYFPRSLADISLSQYRLILAEWGLGPADMEDLSRPDTDNDEGGNSLVALKRRMAEQWQDQMACFAAHPAHGVAVA